MRDWNHTSTMMIKAAFFDTKPYDRQYFEAAAGRVRWRFHDFRLSSETASTVGGASVVCVFVNDRLDRSCIGGAGGGGCETDRAALRG
ncbi:MAG: hypothetical protein ABI318_07765, partial [Chthoniobacteraceae bacterium]